ncbi:hydantoinase/oxoprolinase family protein [Salidesulfovibrio brasiliensis]|uniref:hydantoinase/oxoprolinase family protein n=1 Tax=Salidesulfovibrio brasiliensis TaxID=221711 RepID=UPI0006CFAAB6|nr:hydantoinase/oxoprolinase family protein [Salidesulfovibrio brasiliensis]
MLLGIDVGGTHTDAVALAERGGCMETAASCKVPTDHDDLLGSVTAALRKVLEDVDPATVTRLNLSTTLSTNAIVEGKVEDVGVFVSAGPGIDPHHFMPCRHFFALDGYVDHRGNEIRALRPNQVEKAVNECREHGIRVFAAVGKFSTRHPRHEKLMRRAICACKDENACDLADFVTMGHELGGTLNFPRRVATAYFNCAVWRVYNDFAAAVERSLADIGLGHVHVNVLKADGGTMPLEQSKLMPVQSIFSGPAASVMGIVALCDIVHDSVILDIGGTTTDIAVFAAGAPLVEREGIDIGSHPTLVRALKVRSIGMGGDSAISVLGDEVRVGPNRLGPSACNGGERPTLTDALNMVGESSLGDVEASRRAMEAYGDAHSIPAETLAERAVEYASRTIHEQTRKLVEEINAKPVYTIHELLEGKQVVPRKVYLMGGPAESMRMPLFSRFKLSVEVPSDYSVANAIGAALTRTTWDLELFADTERNVMFIPSLSYRENIPSSYTLEDAKRDALNQLTMHLDNMGVSLDKGEAQITHASSFNMVKDFTMAGRNIRVQCQVRPGVTRKMGSV